jgi:hypothetical protein
LKRLSLLLLLLFLHTTLVLADSAEAEVWHKVKTRMRADTGYSLQADYQGPEGHFIFRYVVHGDGVRILTEVLEGSSRGAGTRLYYDPADDSDNVTMQTSMFRLRRSLQSRDIKDSPIHKPLFSHVLDELDPEPREIDIQKRGNVVFLFGDKKAEHEYLTVDSLGNPVRLTRMEASKEISSLTFRQLEWGEKPMNWDQ